MADEHVLRNLAEGAGDFKMEQFTLRDGEKPDVRFSISARSGIYGPRNRYFLAARYNGQVENKRRAEPEITLFNHTVGQLIPVDDTGTYRVTYGTRTFELSITPPGLPDMEPAPGEGPRKPGDAKITSREVTKK